MGSNDIKPGIYASLIKSANVFVEAMKQKIDQVNAPRKIKEHISIDSPQETGEGTSIDVVIDMSENAAPMAAAYEWGKEPYTIVPGAGKNPFMTFPKGKWPQYQPPPDAPEFFRFSSVEHPEIKARPYIQPTIEETADQIAEILATEFKASILIGEARIEVIG